MDKIFNKVILPLVSIFTVVVTYPIYIVWLLPNWGSAFIAWFIIISFVVIMVYGYLFCVAQFIKGVIGMPIYIIRSHDYSIKGDGNFNDAMTRYGLLTFSPLWFYLINLYMHS